MSLSVRLVLDGLSYLKDFEPTWVSSLSFNLGPGVVFYDELEAVDIGTSKNTTVTSFCLVKEKPCDYSIESVSPGREVK